MARRAECNAISVRLGFKWGVTWGKGGSHSIGRWWIGDAKSVVIL